MSDGRSRSGGSRTGNTLRRKNRSSRNCRARPISPRSRVVAAVIGPSPGTGRVPPPPLAGRLDRAPRGGRRAHDGGEPAGERVHRALETLVRFLERALARRALEDALQLLAELALLVHVVVRAALERAPGALHARVGGH